MLELSLEILASLYFIETLGGRKRMLHVFSRTEGLSGTEKRKSPDQLKVAVFGIGTVVLMQLKRWQEQEWGR